MAVVIFILDAAAAGRLGRNGAPRRPASRRHQETTRSDCFVGGFRFLFFYRRGEATTTTTTMESVPFLFSLNRRNRAAVDRADEIGAAVVFLMAATIT